MARLLLHVEGQTEETFVNDVLRGHLVSRGYSSVGARLMGSGRRRRQRGGVCSWPHALRDICGHLRHDPGCIAGTIVDYYGLPQTGEAAWPGRAAASGTPARAEASTQVAGMRNTFITSSPRWLITLTAMRPERGRGNGRDVSLFRVSQASLSISARRVVLSDL